MVEKFFKYHNESTVWELLWKTSQHTCFSTSLSRISQDFPHHITKCLDICIFLPGRCSSLLPFLPTISPVHYVPKHSHIHARTHPHACKVEPLSWHYAVTPVCHSTRASLTPLLYSPWIEVHELNTATWVTCSKVHNVPPKSQTSFLISFHKAYH
jgi:hypothetical protein